MLTVFLLFLLLKSHELFTLSGQIICHLVVYNTEAPPFTNFQLTQFQRQRHALEEKHLSLIDGESGR